MVDKTPVWQTEEWKNARQERLKEKCQQCGSAEELSLVHLWKPPRYRTIKDQIEQDLIDKLVASNKIEAFDDTDLIEERMACPECRSINLRSRKTKLPRYKCGRCGYETNKPDKIQVRDDYQFSIAYQEWKETVLKDLKEKIKKQIRIKQEEFDQKYRSGEGTTTMCGKCAYLWTQKHMKLCQNCQQNYHKKRYEQCYECNQEATLVLCDKCGKTQIKPQPGDINICESCTETMWDELTK